MADRFCSKEEAMPVQIPPKELVPIVRAVEFLKNTQFSNETALFGFHTHVLNILNKHENVLDKTLHQAILHCLENYREQSKQEQQDRVLKVEGLCLHGVAIDSQTRVLQNHFVASEHVPLKADVWEKKHKKLSQSVQYIKGVGPALGKKLQKAGINNLYDLLKFFPKHYEDRRKISNLNDLQDGQSYFLCAEVIFSGIAYYKGAAKKVYEVIVKDEFGELKLKWFRFYEQQLSLQTKVGHKLFIYGQVKVYKGEYEIHHPEIEELGKKIDGNSVGKITPIYKEVAGVYQKTLRKIIWSALNQFNSHLSCVLPIALCQSLGLSDPQMSLKQLHYPASQLTEMDVYALQKVFIVEELFFYCLSLFLRKKHLQKKEGIAHTQSTDLFEQLKKQLPFTLTQDQSQVLEVILMDMKNPSPMNRLLQGDVGSGKTVVALLAALHAVGNGSQVVFLAPTEVLCTQHYETLKHYLNTMPVQLDLLLGKHTKLEKKAIIESLKSGETDIVIGTHALLEDAVEFKHLGLVVVDEQHRFGVYQRAQLREKGVNPDVLVMSATPIPRTLALTLYGDLDVSNIMQLPAGRKIIETHVCSDQRRMDVYEQIRHAVKKGRQVFVIYPLVEESDKIDLKDASSMAQHFQTEVFPSFRVALMHGKLKSDEKSSIMQQFERHELDILVSTTVIEVGINIPNASVMVIEHPERFGLSQLHQLRGRVGRGEHASKCFLMHPSTISQFAKQRLSIFASNHDGFVLAEEDLKTRGPGDFFGKEQSGFPSFKSALFPRDLSLLEHIRQEVSLLLQEDPLFERNDHQHLPYVLERLWNERIAWMNVA